MRPSTSNSVVSSRSLASNLNNPNLKILQRLFRNQKPTHPKSLSPNLSPAHPNPVRQKLPQPPQTPQLPLAQTEQQEAQDCPLELTELPIISDMQHAVGYCLCYLCTCGLHECPGSQFKKLLSTSAYISTYRQSFKPLNPVYYKPQQPPIQKLKSSYTPDPEYTTTNRKDFAPIKPMPEISLYQRQTGPNLDFAGRNSTYKRNYPNWNVPGAVFHKHIHNAYEPKVSPYKLKSEYSQRFRKHTVQNLRAGYQLKQCLPKQEFIGESTHQKSFQNPYVNKELIQPTKVPSFSLNSEKEAPYPNQYKTSYRNEYNSRIHPRYIPRRKIINFH